MQDIFDAKISCKKCDKEMTPIVVEKNGMHLRAVSCSKCGDKLMHPVDVSKFNEYKDLKGKTFNVKLRMVGNSHAVSIPKEIVHFMEHMNSQMNREMNDTMRQRSLKHDLSEEGSMINHMVRLCFEDFGRVSMRFFDDVEDGGFDGR